MNNDYIGEKSITGSLVYAEDAIAHNVGVIREKTNARIIAVVKENGYGIGLENEYRILSRLGVDMYALSSAQEALKLRQLGCREDILVMTPSYDVEEIIALIKANIIITWESIKQAKLLIEAKMQFGVQAGEHSCDNAKQVPRVHIKIDTGMGRYGFYHSQIPNLSQWKDEFSIEGCFSHLAGHKSHYVKSVRTQMVNFDNALENLKAQGINPGLTHLANSRAMMTFGDLGYSGIRVGSAIVGKCVCPSKANKLQEAVWLEAPVFSIVERPRGTTIGYQSQTLLKRDSRLAIIRVGHGSGVGLCNADDESERFEGRVRTLLSAMKRLLIPRKALTVCIDGITCNVVGKMGVAHMVVDVTGTDIGEGDVMRMTVNPLYVKVS